MQAAVKLTTIVQPGGKVEVISTELISGDTVEVIILSKEQLRGKRRSATDILSEAPGHRLFQSAEEVDAYIKKEREAWDQ